MQSSQLIVYGITVSGLHADLYVKRYYGVAIHIDDALSLVNEKADADGWSEIEFEDITRLGELSFAPWLSEDDDKNSNEVTECQS